MQEHVHDAEEHVHDAEEHIHDAEEHIHDAEEHIHDAEELYITLENNNMAHTERGSALLALQARALYS